MWIGHLHLGQHRLADLALGGPVDVERHLHDDRLGVQRAGLVAEGFGLVGIAARLGRGRLRLQVVGRA